MGSKGEKSTLVVLSMKRIGILTQKCTNGWMKNGAHTQWIDVLRAIMHRSIVSIPQYACPSSEAVDAFTVDWCNENNWWCPPPMLVPRVLRHAERCKAHKTLVVPPWEPVPFWPLLHTHARGWAPFVL